MPSSIAWLDTTAEEQRLSRDLIAMFSETESRDELGIGQIRDAFSDLLFPGTSVVQTRARYYLFIPWCYTRGSAKGLGGRMAKAKGEVQERELITALRTAKLDDDSGLIGKRVGASVRTLPSTIYWSGMLRYGVLRRAEDAGQLGLVTTARDNATELAERAPRDWAGGIPEPPEGFPNSMPSGFTLERPEADWLAERIQTSCADTLLAQLVRTGGSAAKTPWDAVPHGALPELDHARLFSLSIHGAALLYNLLVAEKYVLAGHTTIASPAERYRARIAEWQQDELEPAARDLAVWDIDAMWKLVAAQNPNVAPRTRMFVDEWLGGVRAGRGKAASDDLELRALVLNRERRKGKQSRFVNAKLLETWSGNSGGGLLTYRWGTVATILNDVADGQAAHAAT